MSTRSLIAIVALALAPACASDSTTTVIVEGDPVDETVAVGYAEGDALAAATFDELVGLDYGTQIGITSTILASMYDSEILVADFGAQLAFDDDIFAFANDLIIDAEDANFELESVVRIYGVGYIPTFIADEIAAQGSATIGRLRGSPDFDFEFVESRVIVHAQQQIVLDELYAIIGGGEMGDHILTTMDFNDAHLAEGTALLSTYY